MSKFSEFNLSKNLTNFLEKIGYVNPTPIQSLVIPKVLQGESLVIQSETGSGKTHSFLVPIINSINYSDKRIQAIIISPTRELAQQTYEFALAFKELNNELNVKLISSSDETTKTIEYLSSNPQILICTCGRAKEILANKDLVTLSGVKYIVLDEADMILEDGFIEDVDEIIQILKNPQILVFSATLNKNLQNILLKYISSNFFITTDNSGITSKNVKHFAIDTRHQDIEDCLIQFLKIHPTYFLLIFVSKKVDIDRIYAILTKHKYKTARFHGDLSPRERKSLMKRIRNDEFQIVVCSDIASRGIDLPFCDTVLSIDLPNNIEFYYHRAGRTGRYNRVGESYIFYDNDSDSKIKTLLNLGLEISFFKLANGELVETKSPLFKKKFINKKNDELNSEIRKAKSKISKNKVKPNYKKKANEEARKVKQKYRREIIKKDIRRQRVERYKQESKNK